MKQFLSTTFTICLIVFGLFTLVAWIGVPYHMGIFLSDATWKEIAQACGNTTTTEAHTVMGTMCQGSIALFSWLQAAIISMKPLWFYVVISALAYIGLIVWSAISKGKETIELTLRPWHYFAFFIVSLWLIFNALGHHHFSGQLLATNQTIDPIPEAYEGTSEMVLAEIQRNFADLQERGCLSINDKAIRTQQGNQQIRLYDYTFGCMQYTFATRVLSQVLLVVLLLFEFLIFGRLLLQLLPLRPRSKLEEAMLSLAGGILGFVVVLWVVALVGLLHWQLGWALLLLIPAVGYKHTLYWAKQFLTYKHSIQYSWWDVRIVLCWLLISYLALNFFTVIRPFPIGWDDLGSYINRPRLLVSYGSFIHLLPNFQWEYMTALGFLLFGYNSVHAVTAAMIINWMAGLLAVFGLLGLGNILFKGKGGLISALLYYMLPVVGHFAFADMKIDNALFFMCTVATFCVMNGMFFLQEEDTEEELEPVSSSLLSSWSTKHTWIALGGLFAGLAFGFKITALIAVFGLLVIIAGGQGNWATGTGMMMLCISVYFYMGQFKAQVIFGRIGWSLFANIPQYAYAGLFAALGLALFVYQWTKSKVVLRNVLTYSAVFTVSFVVCIAPWLLHNNLLAGNIIPRPVFSAPNLAAPDVSYESLPEELAIDRSHEACTSTARDEELGRYWGEDETIWHYLGLPWRTVMNIDAPGYYVTSIPMLLLFPLLILLPFFWKRKEGKWLRWLYVATFFMVLQWILVANGVPWYGIMICIGLCTGLETLWQKSSSIGARIVSAVLLGLAIFLMLGMRFWQLNDFHRNNIEYPIGKASPELVKARTVPLYDDIANVVVNVYEEQSELENGRPYLYRIGTFIPYFIPKNLEIIAASDAQLDRFNCLNQEAVAIHKQYEGELQNIEDQLNKLDFTSMPDSKREEQRGILQEQKKNIEGEYSAQLADAHSLTGNRLRALGFGTIIFDTNTHTIEKKAGTLHAKVRYFVEFANDPASGVRIPINKPGQGIAFMIIE